MRDTARALRAVVLILPDRDRGEARMGKDSLTRTLLDVGKQKTFEYPTDLRQAQQQLDTAQAERQAFLSSLPVWGGDLEAALRGLDEEQPAESGRLAESERQPSLRVTEHGFWATLSARTG
ncbi:hypothetical protein ACIGXI_35505 [Kitasatospora aureofaciens]|uniref:hypothetical protein n=1 Tax=Kitasatospora aureofaciens TaxID=1894 RepID=UPI0037CAB4B2